MLKRVKKEMIDKMKEELKEIEKEYGLKLRKFTVENQDRINAIIKLNADLDIIERQPIDAE